MKRVAALFLATCACASAPARDEPMARKGGSVAEDREVAATLRHIRARVLRGEGAQAREELAARLAERRGDPRLRLFAAWTGAPSESAWQEIHQLASENAKEPWLPTAEGLIYLQWRNFLDQADEAFARALAIWPGFAPAQVGQADVLRQRGRLKEAAAAYQAVLARVPDWQEAVAGLGLTLMALRDDAAQQTLERAVQLEPDDPRAVAALAELSLRAKNLERAVELYSKVVVFDPKDRASRVTLASLEAEKGDLEGAARVYEEALALATPRCCAPSPRSTSGSSAARTRRASWRSWPRSSRRSRRRWCAWPSCIGPTGTPKARCCRCGRRWIGPPKTRRFGWRSPTPPRHGRTSPPPSTPTATPRSSARPTRERSLRVPRPGPACPPRR